VLIGIVVRLRSHEDLGRGGCGTRKRSRKTKDGTGASGAGDASVLNSVELSVPPTGRTGEAILTETQINQTEVQLGGEDRQLEETREQLNGAGSQLGAASGQLRDEQDGEAESSETGNRADPNVQRDGRTGPVDQMAEPSMKEVLDAIKGTRKRSRKTKDGTGASGAGDASVLNPVELSVPPTGWTGEAILTETQINQTEVQLGGEDRQLEETREQLNGAGSQLGAASGQLRDEQDGEAESSETGNRADPNVQRDGRTGPVAWFECTETIDDVVNGSGWYYIGCGVCHTKATKGPTTLMCKKCGKSEIVGVAQYLSKLSVYDHSDQAVFVVLGDAGEELTGKKAAELVERYYEVDMKPANDSVGEDHIVPVPQAIIDTIGQTWNFIVKVSNHNLTAKTQTLTVTKVLPLEAPEPEGNLGVNVGKEGDSESEDHADKSVKRGADGIESEGVKRAKCG
ncbi:hypothetical protein IGI04_014912, partial [Brassica rapa subsp. trilocularis]